MLTTLSVARTRLLVLLLTLLALALRFWQLDVMPLFGDEAYYLLWAERLAPSYFDHPAGIALLLKASTLLAGRGEFGVRWLTALLSTACVPLAYRVGQRYVSAWGGIAAAGAVAFGPVYVITGRVAYPDTLQDFLLLLSLLAAYPVLVQSHPGKGKETVEGQVWSWVRLGLALALLLNTKLTAVFLPVALAAYVMGWRRDLLRTRGLWLAVGMAVVGVAPVVAWNAAHDWATMRLALGQGGNFGLPAPALPAAWFYAVRYLSPPAVILGGAAAIRFAFASVNEYRKPPAARRQPDVLGWCLLGVVAGCVTLPVLLSAANSPRNLGLGCLALWPLIGIGAQPGGGRPARRYDGTRKWPALAGICLAALAIYAAGTVAALLGSSRLPQSAGATPIRLDAAGWPEIAHTLAPPEDAVVFAIDYSIAGQLSFYLDRPVYSSAGQFRVWGVPELDRALVLSQGYVPADLVTERLRGSFSHVEGPARLEWLDSGDKKNIYIWRARGQQEPTAELVESLDFLSLARSQNRQR